MMHPWATIESSAMPSRAALLLLSEHKLGRRVLGLIRADGPGVVVKVQKRVHAHEVHVRLPIGIDGPYVAPVLGFLFVLILEIVSADARGFHHLGHDILAEVMGRVLQGRPISDVPPTSLY